MFTRTSRTDKAREQVADVTSSVSDTWRAKVAPVVGAKARDAAHWAAPRVERGREVAAPKVGAAVGAAREKVSPAVDAAREKVSPAVEAAREKIEDVLPRLVEAVTAAAAAGAAAGVTAKEYSARSGDAVAVLKGEAVAKRKRGGVLRKLLLFPVLVAAAAAAYAAFRSRTPKEDPWAVPTGNYPAYTPPAPAAAPGSADLTTGDAADALDSTSTAEVPGLSVDSTDAQPDVDQGSTSPEPSEPIEPTDHP